MSDERTPKPIPWWLRLIVLGGFTVFVLHFTLTGIYALPEAPVPETIRVVARKYSYPVFHQGWKLFAPDVPSCDFELAYKVYADGEWSGELSIDNLGGVPNHHKVEFSRHKISTLLAHGLGMECDDRASEATYRNRIYMTGAYYRAYYYVRRRIQLAQGGLPDSVALVLRRHSLPPFGGGTPEPPFEVWFDAEPLNE
jgi:hypothetical protein